MMERLTYRDKDGFPMMKKRGGFKRGGVERLAAYEDTWLEPEEITAMRHTLDEYHKVVDPLIRAQADGRLVVLPCKVGDTVYRLFAGNPDNPVIATLKINTVAEAVKLIGKMGMHKYIGTFITLEEAEKALEALKDE
jgi:hypothetical protein